MSDSEIYRNSLDAWRALSAIGGLEPYGRDQDLADQIKHRLRPHAATVEQALADVSVADFLSALLAAIEPFTGIFRDVLAFFERAKARFGQNQWRLSVGSGLIDLKHFEEFIESLSMVDYEIDVPALDRGAAFVLNHVRLEQDEDDRLARGRPEDGGPIVVGIPDVDEWLAGYHAGQYLPFPNSLYPESQPPGLDDAAKVVMAALHVIRARGLDRQEMLDEHRARSFASDPTDAFHPWTIAQSETDYWLRSNVQYLGNLLLEPNEKRVALGRRVAQAYARFGRRQFSSSADIRTLERILSLPAWKRRYELYGVWVGTQIIDALDDHNVTINHDRGVMRFAFTETRLAEVASSRPPLSIYTERRSALSDPVGKSRKAAAQPDYGIWTTDASDPKCKLVVEVKHYKRESISNFRAALVDYASAHPEAKIVLVNYGPAKADYGALLRADADRCTVIGYLKPDFPETKSRLRALVREAVGDPVRLASVATAVTGTESVVIDISASMSDVLESPWFWSLVNTPDYEQLQFHLVDSRIKAVVRQSELRKWMTVNGVGNSTSLLNPIRQLLNSYESLMLVTDDNGARDLAQLNVEPIEVIDMYRGAKLLRIIR